MLSAEVLKKIAVKSETSSANIIREYAQVLFLRALYAQPNSENVLFKGGTCLRLVYQSPRFSEDLDFSAGLPVGPASHQILEDLLERSLISLERQGLSIDILESKPTSGGHLAIFTILIADVNISLKFEVSLRESKLAQREIRSVKSEFLPIFDVFVLAEELMTHEKLTALLSRQKARDFYDLYFFLRTRMKIRLSRQEILAVSSALNKLSPEWFFKDLKEFFPKSHRLVIRDLPRAIISDLARQEPIPEITQNLTKKEKDV